MTVCVISQPRFFPGFHYLHRMMLADVFVILDTVQFTPRHEENRAKLKAPEGARWLTVPMCQSHREQPIYETRIDSTQPWRRKATGTLRELYGRAPSFEVHAPEIFEILEGPHATLTELDVASWGPALRRLGVACEFVRASSLPVTGHGPQLLLDICTCLGADTYVSGAFGREYLDPAVFTAAGVDVRFHDYTYPVYPQRFGTFVPFLSYLDALFNGGLDRASVLAGGRLLPARETVG